MSPIKGSDNTNKESAAARDIAAQKNADAKKQKAKEQVDRSATAASNFQSLLQGKKQTTAQQANIAREQPETKKNVNEQNAAVQPNAKQTAKQAATKSTSNVQLAQSSNAPVARSVKKTTQAPVAAVEGDGPEGEIQFAALDADGPTTTRSLLSKESPQQALTAKSQAEGPANEFLGSDGPQAEIKSFSATESDSAPVKQSLRTVSNEPQQQSQALRSTSNETSNQQVTSQSVAKQEAPQTRTQSSVQAQSAAEQQATTSQATSRSVTEQQNAQQATSPSSAAETTADAAPGKQYSAGETTSKKMTAEQARQSLAKHVAERGDATATPQGPQSAGTGQNAGATPAMTGGKTPAEQAALRAQNAGGGAASPAAAAEGSSKADPANRLQSDTQSPDVKAVAGVGPAMGAAGQAMPIPGATPPPPKWNPSAVVQQMIEYAGLTKDEGGATEFRLGLAENVLGGAKIRMRTHGNKRIGLTISKANALTGIGEAEVAQLVEMLKARGMDVIDVNIES